MVRQHTDDETRDEASRPDDGANRSRMVPSEMTPSEMTRSEEELRVDRTPEEAGRVHARKVVEHHPIEQLVDRDV
jgi:hypothetical protein